MHVAVNLATLPHLLAAAGQSQPFWQSSWTILWAGIALIVIVPAGIRCFYKLRRAQIDAELKHDMIARGMSADEIERVLAADRGSRSKSTVE